MCIPSMSQHYDYAFQEDTAHKDAATACPCPVTKLHGYYPTLDALYV